MRELKNVAVIGAGTMGMGIAAHLASQGIDVHLLDILPTDLADERRTDQSARNAIAEQALQRAVRANQQRSLYAADFAERVHPGNLEDHLSNIGLCDWIIEAVVENLAVKNALFERIEAHRRAGTLVTTNTSGIPIQQMAAARSPDFQQHFCGTHFFNPVGLMRLLEIIPSSHTSTEVVHFLMDYGRTQLHKETVLCKDTPGFIANRIGFFSGVTVMDLAVKYQISIENTDYLVGEAINRPKTGVFRLRDLTGVDVGAKIRRSFIENLPQDEWIRSIQHQPLPRYWQFLLDQGYLGNKSGQGFYQKTEERDAAGRRRINALNLTTLQYRPAHAPNLPIFVDVQQLPWPDRLSALLQGTGSGSDLLREYLANLFAYSANRIPEIADQIYSIDTAMRTGYAWGEGPFELWDLVGVRAGLELIAAYRLRVSSWVQDMLNVGCHTFYRGKAEYYDITRKAYHKYNH